MFRRCALPSLLLLAGALGLGGCSWFQKSGEPQGSQPRTTSPAPEMIDDVPPSEDAEPTADGAEFDPFAADFSSEPTREAPPLPATRPVQAQTQVQAPRPVEDRPAAAGPAAVAPAWFVESPVTEGGVARACGRASGPDLRAARQQALDAALAALAAHLGRAPVDPKVALARAVPDAGTYTVFVMVEAAAAP